MLSKKSLRSQDIAVSRHTLQMEARSRSYMVVLPKVTFEEYTETGKYAVKLVSIYGGGHVVPNPYKKTAFMVGKTATNVNSAELCGISFISRISDNFILL